jgi:glycosyltransferase involved in cell wall biosynthesis
MGGLPWGGSEALWYTVAMHSLKQGDTVMVSVYDWEKPNNWITNLKKAGAFISFRKRYNPEPGMWEKVSRFIKNRAPRFNKDYQSIIDFKPGVVLISQGDSFDLTIHHRGLYDLIRGNQIPYSFICHNHEQYGYIPPKEIYPGAVEIFKNAMHVFFISKRQWQLTERRLIRKIDNGMFTWNPLNLEIPIAPLQWPDGDTAQMAIVANITGSKGHDTAFEVLGRPAWRERQWRLNIYGNGVGMDYLKELSVFYGIADNIVFHGHVSNILNIWHVNQLLLIPSAGEGLPISLAEAMICGRPAVATDVGGNTELITENDTGFIAVSPSTEAFAAAMENAWSAMDKWKNLGNNAFNKINSVLDREPGLKIYELLKHE